MLDNLRLVLLGSGYGTVGRTVVSYNKGPEFESSHLKNY